MLTAKENIISNKNGSFEIDLDVTKKCGVNRKFPEALKAVILFYTNYILDKLVKFTKGTGKIESVSSKMVQDEIKDNIVAKVY